MDKVTTSWRPALEKAAKYICNQKCGKCPMVVENHPCPVECSTEVVPWQCWLAYFAAQAEARRDSG